MHYPDHPTADFTDPTKPQFRSRDDATGTVGTRVTADWLNDVANNLMATVLAGSVVPTKLRDADLADAIARIAAGRDATRARLLKSVAGGQAEVILTDAEAGAPVVRLTGERTDDLLLTWPDTYSGARWVHHGATGAHAISTRAATQDPGTAVELPAGKWSLVALDGDSVAVLLSAAGDGSDGGVGAIEQGLHQISIPAAAMLPAATGGAEADALETAGGRNYSYLAFDAASAEAAEATIPMPKSWDGGTLMAEFIWTHPASDTNFAVRWSWSCYAIGSGEALDAGGATAQALTAAGGETDRAYITARTAATTPAGTPAGGELLQIRVTRAASHEADTLAVDARLLGVRIAYTVAAATDA